MLVRYQCERRGWSRRRNIPGWSNPPANVITDQWNPIEKKLAITCWHCFSTSSKIFFSQSRTIRLDSDMKISFSTSLYPFSLCASCFTTIRKFWGEMCEQVWPRFLCKDFWGLIHLHWADGWCLPKDLFQRHHRVIILKRFIMITLHILQSQFFVHKYNYTDVGRMHSIFWLDVEPIGT